MANSRTWNAANEASPADTDNVSDGAGKIRDLKVDVRERMSIDHYFDIAGTDADHGEHLKITLHAPLGSNPAPGANKGAVYSKDVSAKAELHWQDEDGNVLQLTSAGQFPGDTINIVWNPSFYTPAIVSPATDVDDLTAHLKGIDNALGSNNIERGAVMSNNGTDPGNDIDITAGARIDDGFTTWMINSAITKRLDAAWAVGTNQGGIDAGSKANNTWYHVWIIKRIDTGVVDALFSTSATSPTMPAAYTKKARIGAVRTGPSGYIIAFKQIKNRILWGVPYLDNNSALGDTSAHLITLRVPTGIQVEALIRAANSVNFNSTLISSPSITDTAGAAATAPLFNVTGGIYVELTVLTDTSARVRARAATGSETLYIATVGWIDQGARLI